MIPGRNIWFVAFNIGRRRDKQRDTILWFPRNLFITCVRTNWRNWGQAKENSSLQMWHTSKRRNTVIIWNSTPAFINTPFEWAPLFTAEKFTDRPGLNEDTPPSSNHERGAHLKFEMSEEVLFQKVCKNDKTKVFFGQIFFAFYNKEIYKHIL